MRFAELLALPEVEEDLRLAGRFGFLAFHGGSLEETTDVIAAGAAEQSGASLYTVRLPADLYWHIPSSEVLPEASDRLAAFLDHVDVAVAIHGYGRVDRWTTILAGGQNRALAAALAEELARALPDYEVVDDLEAIPPELRGLHGSNPVNRSRQRGVHLELPPRVRGLGPHWDGHPARAAGVLVPHTRALIDALATVAAAW